MSRVCLLCLSLALAGCSGMAPTQVPIPSIETVNPGRGSNTLVVMLPGFGDRADTFLREEFEAAGIKHGFDTVAVDAHFGYYKQRSILDRLHEDVILPAKTAGYSRIWLLGISMGGLGSLLYAAEYPDEVDGVILLAPFLGDRKAIESIVATGPLVDWNGQGDELEDYELAIWTWLRDVARNPDPTPIMFGYGVDDRMAEGYRKLVDYMPVRNVYTREGGHKWKTWRPLWYEMAADL